MERISFLKWHHHGGHLVLKIGLKYEHKNGFNIISQHMIFDNDICNGFALCEQNGFKESKDFVD